MGAGLAILISGIVAAIASAGVGIFNTISSAQENQSNIEAQKDANAANIAMQRETNEQNEQLMRESWQRDDTAIQRSMADAKAAGLSPLAGLGGSNNSGPITLSAPQTTAVHSNMNRSGFTQIGDAVKSLADIPYMATQGAMQDEQLEQMRLQNEAMRDSNVFSKFKMLKEFDNIDLQNSKLRREIEDYIGDMLARGVLSTNDTKGTKWSYVKPSNRYEKEDAIRNESNKNTSRSNEIASWKESNRHEEWQSEFNSTTETREQEQEIKFSYLGQEVKLRYKESSTGQYIPVSAGIPSNENPYKTLGYAQPAAVINELGDGYHFAGWTSDGLPVLSVKIPTFTKPQFLAIVPKGKGSQLYKIDSNYVTSGDIEAWKKKYGVDYGNLLYKLQNSKAF